MVAQWQEAGAGKRRSDTSLTRASALAPISAVVFEPAGVLFDATPRRRWLWQLVSRHGVQKSYDDFFEPWEREFLPSALCGKCKYADVLQAFLNSLGLSPGQLDEIVAALPLRGQPLEAGVRPLVGVARALSRLNTCGAVLAILAESSLTANAYREHLAQLGLDGQFSVIVTSAEIKSLKPTEASYHAVANRLKVPAAGIAFVATDSDDLRGAAAVGMRTISVGAMEPSIAEFAAPSFQRLPDLLISALRPRSKAA